MMFKQILVKVFWVVAFCWMPFFVPAQTQNANAHLADEVLVLINKHRATMNLKPLKKNEKIIPVATTHSRNMAVGDVAFGHDGFDDRADILKNKIPALTGMAENVAYGTRLSAQAVVKMWLNSPGHRENIEGNYNETGIGIYKNSASEIYFTQIFVKTGLGKK
jgi:uncharacterized protein YkwD